MTVQNSMNAPTPRRGFLARLAASVATVGGGLTLPSMLGAAPDQIMRDDVWMRGLTGKHRTVFDAAAHRNGRPLVQAKNYFDAWRDGFKVPEQQINLVIGVSGEALPLLVTDAVWSRFRLGERFDISDPATKAPSTKNLFISANLHTPGPVSAEQTIEALQKRGTRFIVCLNSIGNVAGMLSAAGFGTTADVRAAIISGLLPGVIPVPAMVVAFTQLQELGVSYTKVA